jgi:hypothetical protein
VGIPARGCSPESQEVVEDQDRSVVAGAAAVTAQDFARISGVALVRATANRLEPIVGCGKHGCLWQRGQVGCLRPARTEIGRRVLLHEVIDHQAERPLGPFRCRLLPWHLLPQRARRGGRRRTKLPARVLGFADIHPVSRGEQVMGKMMERRADRLPGFLRLDPRLRFQVLDRADDSLGVGCDRCHEFGKFLPEIGREIPAEGRKVLALVGRVITWARPTTA